MSQQSSYGEVHGPRAGEISRRGFMRRMLGVGVGILSLEFLGGTLAFLWPNISEGLGASFSLGTAEAIVNAEPGWPMGTAYSFQQANIFFVNVPAAKALVQAAGDQGSVEPVPDPGSEVLALYRTCPHLGCQIPPLCDVSDWFECLCHGSKYTVLGEKRDGPAPRGMDRFNVVVAEDGYTVDTSELVSGPPVGTVTFDERAPTDMSHCTG